MFEQDSASCREHQLLRSELPMANNFKSYLFLTLVVSAIAALAEPAPEPAKPGVIVRGPSSSAKGWLIPAWLLQKPYEDWSRDEQALVSPKVVDEFNEYLDTVGTMNRSGVCTPGEGIPTTRPAESWREKISLYDVAGTQKNIILGEIVGLEPAWDVGSYQVATLVQLKVVRVIRSIDPITPGDVVLYRRPWGSFNVRGVQLCSYLEPVAGQTHNSAESPTAVERKLQTILLLGRLVPGNSNFMGSGRFEEFQVVEGKIYYPRGISYYPEQPELLSVALSKFSGASQ